MGNNYENRKSYCTDDILLYDGAMIAAIRERIREMDELWQDCMDYYVTETYSDCTPYHVQ